MSTISSSIPRPSVRNGAPAGSSSAAKGGKNKNLKKYGLLALLLLIIAGSSYAFWASRLPKPGTEAANKFVATDRFANLSDAQKKPYLDQLEKMSWDDRRKAFDKLSQDEREKAFANTMGDRFGKELDQYAKMAPAEKTKFLDERIDREEQWAARAQNNNNGNNNGGGRGRGGMGDPARMKSRMENMAPGRRAAMAQMAGEMAKRRAERGLPPSRWGGAR